MVKIKSNAKNAIGVSDNEQSSGTSALVYKDVRVNISASW